MTVKKTRKKRLQKQTLTEFRAWLSGVEEMQDDGWVPSESQWQLIRERIGLITEPEPVVHTPPQPAARPAQMGHTPDAGGLDLLPQVPSAFDKAAVSEVSSGPVVTPAPRPATQPNQTVKTPDVDTSQGEYKSGFL